MRSFIPVLPLMVLAFVCARPAQSFAFENAAAPTLEMSGSRVAGAVSRYQREVIVTGQAKNPNASPASQYFDDVMSHLEVLMADEIAKNNRIAALQKKIPGYEF